MPAVCVNNRAEAAKAWNRRTPSNYHVGIEWTAEEIMESEG